MNSSLNGRFVVVVEPRNVNRVAEYHEGKVDLVATEEVISLDPSVRVLVQKGSNILKDHQNRTEL